MAKLVSPDGTVVEIQPKNGRNFSLKEMYKQIDCDMIQICDGKDGKIIVFDEFFNRGDIAEHDTMGQCIIRTDQDGNETYEPYLNRIATNALHPRMLPFTHTIVCGKAIICKSSEVD